MTYVLASGSRALAEEAQVPDTEAGAKALQLMDLLAGVLGAADAGPRGSRSTAASKTIVLLELLVRELGASPPLAVLATEAIGGHGCGWLTDDLVIKNCCEKRMDVRRFLEIFPGR